MAEEVLNLLAGIPELKVISRTSSFSFRGRKVGIQKIGETLKVAHVLEGSVRRSGSKLRISAQLISTETEFQLWSQNYDREMEDVFSIQDVIASAIAEKMQVTLLGDNKRLKRQRPKSLEAYELALEGRYEVLIPMEGVINSIGYAEKALKLEPDRAMAHYGVDLHHFFMALYGITPPVIALPKIMRAAQRAISIDPDFVLGHLLLADTGLAFEWDWAQAKRHMEMSKALEPNNPFTLRTQASWYFVCENEEACIRTMNSDVLMESKDGFSMFDRAIYNAAFGRDDVAEDYFKGVLAIAPYHSESIRWLSDIYRQRRDYDKALDFAQRAYEGQFGLGMSSATLVRAHLTLGNTQEATNILEQMLKGAESEYVQPSVFAVIYGALEDLDKMFDWLDKAYQANDNPMTYVRYHPCFEIARSDPRYDELMEKMNFPTD